jgi:hypothetical protein
VAQALEAELDLQPMVLRRASSPVPAIVLCLSVLAAICAATAYAVSNGRFAEQFWLETASAAIPDPTVSATLKDIRSSQQQNATKLLENAAVVESLTQSSIAQQADLKRIFDQLSSLAARVDAIQNVATPVTTSTQPTARVPAVRPSQKKPSRIPKPSGPVSVGGAPLRTAPMLGSGRG